ncbi:GOLPH3/VPS74 family protein [Brevibacterium yomogidense]|uniref:GOLPH3/VPS74 family protein n=1 Tax=Brevibacterium yomogidense TaxID=946573 RepID=UPI0018DF06B1|nr:GPP34 family phosphoprotein [Brevibacterium yomogidense]
MLISEDLLLLLTRDDGRTEAWVSYRDYALAAGLLSDLALAECVEFEPGKKRNPRVLMVGGTGGSADRIGGPAGSVRGAGGPIGGAAGAGGGSQPDGPGAIMAFGLQALAARSKPPRVQSLITAGWFNPKVVVSRSLMAQGVVGLEEARFLGLKPERYPVVDDEPERLTRARLHDALAGRGEVSVTDAMILGILRGMDAAKVVLKEEAASAGLKGRALSKRIERISEELPEAAQRGNQAIKGVIDAMNAAIMGAVTAAAASGAAASS